jgi:hypothetical protein
MNEIPFSDIKEFDDLSLVRTHLQNGWMCLEIYKKKRQVFGTNDEFEEKPVYVLGDPQGG